MCSAQHVHVAVKSDASAHEDVPAKCSPQELAVASTTAADGTFVDCDETAAVVAVVPAHERAD